MFTVDDLLNKHFPQLNNVPVVSGATRAVLRRLLHEKEFIEFARDHPHSRGHDFVDEVLRYFNFNYTLKHSQRENIPATGRVVIVSNHPLGSLDALALCKCISEVRRDVKLVANQVLMQLEPMQELLLPVNNMGGGTRAGNIKAIEKHLEQEGALIIFPAGEVSRLGRSGVVDSKWRTGFLHFAISTCSPILPVFSGARNSALFYGASALYKPASTALLVQEMFNQENQHIDFTVGEVIPYHSYQDIHLPLKHKAHLFKRHLYRLGKGKSLIFKTERSIAYPEDREELVRDLKQHESLGKTSDGKEIFLYSYSKETASVMREIGRLREVAFRAVGEGSGKRRDLDSYDHDYRHIVLWDDADQEIVGSYRLALTQELIDNKGVDGLYTSSLFDFEDAMQPYFEQGIELGRSFIQPRYWGRRSLDYLWFGVGAFIARNPEYRYLFGPVSISNSMPTAAKALMVYFYQLHFGAESPAARHKQPYELPPGVIDDLKGAFKGESYEEDFTQLKAILSDMGTSVPTLYKQYSELCEPGGVCFFDFGVDPDFADCIDGLVVVDVHLIKKRKFDRYIGAHQLQDEAEAS